MNLLPAARLSRLWKLIIPLTILVGCGDGDGPQRIANQPAAPYDGPPDSCFEALTFEDVCGFSYSFAEFFGAPADIVAVADESRIAGDAGNTSDKVVATIKLRNDGPETFGGFVLTVTSTPPAPFDIPAGSAITIKIWAQRPVPVLLEPHRDRGDGQNLYQGQGTEVQHGGTGWEELTFDLPAGPYDATGFVFIFDQLRKGDFDNDPDSWIFYIDDITLVEGEPPEPATFPITFDEDPPPLVTEFGGAGYAYEPGPAGGGDGNTLRIVRDGGEAFAGAWVAVAEIPNDAGPQTISAEVYSPTAGIRMVAKAEYADNQGSGEVEANEVVVEGWQTLTWTFTNLAAPNVYNRFTILPNLGNVDSPAQSYYFDNIDLEDSEPPPPPATLGPVDFEPDGQGAGFTWAVFENGDNPPLEIIANPDATGANTSANVAQFTARQAGQPFAGTITSDLPTFTLDASNAIVRIKVWKAVISDVGIKFENASGGSTGEIRVANTVVNQWEELTFDFSGVIGDPVNTDITGLVVFPDFDARTQDNVIYFDDITFSATGG